MKILGVRIDEITREDANKKVADFLERETAKTIFTPNPEMIVDAHYDNSFKEVLNCGSLNICDGRGVELLSRGRLKRLTGVDFMLDICELAIAKNACIYLLGSGSSETLQATKSALKKRFPAIQIVGMHKGPEISFKKEEGIMELNINQYENNDILSDIVMVAPDILFVAFGHNKQEKWIDANINALPSVKIAMGVGGAFDYISGRISRAPQWMRIIGLEWLYRLVREPQRAKRIFKAVVVFPFLYILNTIKRKDI